MILVDTGPLVALCDPRDRYHRTALSHLTRLAPVGLCTCEAVLMEACFHLPSCVQRERLRAVVRDLRVEPLLTGDTELRDDVFAWLIKYAEHQPDWADGCQAVLCGRDRRLKLWTYDVEFVTTWRRPDGTRIPIAVKNHRAG